MFFKNIVALPFLHNKELNFYKFHNNSKDKCTNDNITKCSNSTKDENNSVIKKLYNK